MRHRLIGGILAGMVLAAGLVIAQTRGKPASPACDPTNGGLTLPPGFCALIVADNIGPARHLVVAANGDIYMMVGRPRGTTTLRQAQGVPSLSRDEGGGLAALRDADGDGRTEIVERKATLIGTGIELRGDYLYLASDVAVGRLKMTPGQLLPTGDPEMIVEGFLPARQHQTKSFTFDDRGNMYVGVGAPSNVCQAQDRQPKSPGQDPCPLLERHGGIWRFNADKPGQTQEKDGYHFATGIRNVVAINWNTIDKQVYILQHGRDALNLGADEATTAKQNAELPAEEMFRLRDGANYGWPRCYYDTVQKKRILSPEFGGDGKSTAGCEKFDLPVVAFPAHTAPNDIVFYVSNQFPAEYRNGAFVAFHGSWNRAPEPQEGYHVMFQPFKGSEPSGAYEIFADGFAGATKGPQPSEHRPVGLAIGPDGSLYVSDSKRGTIWRILYKG